MHVRIVFLRNIALLAFIAAVFLCALVFNALLPGAGFGTVLIVIVAFVLAAFGVFLAWGSAVARADLGAVDALNQGRRPKPGELAAAYGTVRAEGPLLEAPLTGTQCVAYEYSVHYGTRAAEGENRNRYLCYEGRHLTPTVLDGPDGRVRVEAFPSLEEYIVENPDVERARGLAERLDKQKKLTLFDYLRSRSRTNRDSHVSLAQDWFLRQPAWESVKLDERALPADTEACAIGVWSENGPALGSPYAWRRTRMSIEPGKPEEVAARLREDAGQLARLAKWCLGIAAALLCVMPILAAIAK